VKFIPHAVYKAISVLEPIFSKEAEVYLLDYIGGNTFVKELAPIVKHITIIDHHKTAVEVIDSLRANNQMPKNLDVHIVMDKSGATLAWDIFFPGKTLVQGRI